MLIGHSYFYPITIYIQKFKELKFFDFHTNCTAPKFFAKVLFFSIQNQFFFTLLFFFPFRIWSSCIFELPQHACVVSIIFEIFEKNIKTYIDFQIIIKPLWQIFRKLQPQVSRFSDLRKMHMDDYIQSKRHSFDIQHDNIFWFFRKCFRQITPPWLPFPLSSFPADHKQFLRNNPCTLCSISPGPFSD